MNKTKRIIFITLGSITLALGFLGLFLPLLPTTPFWLLTAGLYMKASPEWYQWLMNRKYVGEHIRNFREHKAIPLRGKICSISLLWITIGISIYLIPLWWVRILLLCIAIGVSIHILSYKTLKK